MIDFQEVSKLWDERQKFRKDKERQLHKDMVDTFNEISNKK